MSAVPEEKTRFIRMDNFISEAVPYKIVIYEDITGAVVLEAFYKTRAGRMGSGIRYTYGPDTDS